MAAKKEKTIKKVTEIPNASVKIEVEEKADGESVEEVVKEEVTEESTKTPESEESTQTAEESAPQIQETNESLDSGGGMSWKKIILLIIVIVPVGFLMFGGFLYFTDNMNLSFMKKPSEEKKIEITQMTPTPTKAEVNKEEFVIEVQNGSGIAGEGAKVKEMLEDAGFTVGLVGNADTADYEDTIIKVNDEVSEAFTDELTKVLEKRGSVAKVEKLATGEDGQVIVIVGGNVKETSETPTPTP